ncbi:hypothetical protein Tco_0978356, partial [Tanacetum coccineum]
YGSSTMRSEGPVFDFGGLPDLMTEGLSARMLMEHMDAQGQTILDLDMLGALQFQLGRRETDPRQGDLRDYWIGISLSMDFLGTAPPYTFIRDPMLRLCHRLITYSIAGRRPARQEGGARGVAEEASVAPGGGDEDEEMPQAMPPPPRTQGKRIARLEEEVHGVREALQGQREVLDSMACDFSRFSIWTITSLARMMDRAGVPYTRFSESPVEYKRRTKQRTGEASTSTAP